MTSLSDEQLLQYGKRSKGKVVLVTGTSQNAHALAPFADAGTPVLSQASNLGSEKKPHWSLPISSELPKENNGVSQTRTERVRDRAKLVLGNLNAVGIYCTNQKNPEGA